MTSARFVVESPFQLLMANEARHQMDLVDDSELVILWPSEDQARQTIRDVLRWDEWPVVIDGGVRSSRSMPERARLIHRMARDPKHELFVGDYLSPFMRHLLMKQAPGSGWLLDDGTGTVNTWSWRNEEGAPHRRPKTQNWRRRSMMKGLGLDGNEPEILRYFTIFDLEASETELIRRNDLSLLRSRLPDSEPDDSMLLLGSPFSDIGVMSEDHYIDLVSRVASQHSATFYRPHRRETPSKLARLESIVTLVPGTGTIELAITEAESLPRVIMSFFSSAAFTLHLLVGDKVRVGSYVLRASDFLGAWFEIGDTVPALLRQTAGKLPIEVIPGRPSSDLDSYESLIAPTP